MCPSKGSLIANLQAHGIQTDYADLYQPAALLPVIAAYHALIFMGGPMVNDDLPYLHREMEFIRTAVERRQPVLGICPRS
jgi:GMP synthase-like glutamine amidotransferase